MMENMRREGKLCDVNIIVGGHTLQGHRLVLAANIPYFGAMFTHDMAESRQPNITMHDIDPTAAESLVDFAYTGRVTISTSQRAEPDDGGQLPPDQQGEGCLCGVPAGPTLPRERVGHQNLC